MKFDNLSSSKRINKWINESYRECRASYPIPTKGRIAFDIGANVGGFCIHAHKNFDRIYAFEPLIQNYSVTKEVLKSLKINNVDLFNTAIFSESGKIMKMYSGNDSCISGDVTLVLDGINKEQKDSGQTCETISLKDAMESLGVEKIDYLKMDCEGSEYEILENFYDYHKIDLICMEIHQLYGYDRKKKLLKMLENFYYLTDINKCGEISVNDAIQNQVVDNFENLQNVLLINRNLT